MRIEISRVWQKELKKYKLKKCPFATIEEKRRGDTSHYAIVELEEKYLLDFLKWVISNTGCSIVIDDDFYCDEKDSDLKLKIYDDYME